jgi:protein involved in polysaccharide export with SLBB domain
VPVTGLYSVSATVYWSSFTTTAGHGIAIRRNGAEQIVTVFAGSNAARSANGTVQHVSGVYKLTAGDSVNVTAFQASGASRSLVPTAVSSNFTVTLIR